MSDPILQNLELLSGEIRHLRQLVHHQAASLHALRIYTVAKLADFTKADRKKAFDEIADLTRKVYDAHISKVEEINPAHAADIDLRSCLEEPDQEMWYLAAYTKKPE